MTSKPREPDDRQRDVRLAQAVDIDTIYAQYGRRTLAFLTTLGLQGADADDVHQTAWIRVVQALRKQPFEGNFRAWLFQVMRNAAIDSFRKRTPDSLDQAVAAATIGAVGLPDAAMVEAEARQALERCLEQLEAQSREIVRCRLQGDNSAEIADRLELDVSRTYRIFFDAKASLTKCLQRAEVA